MKVIVYAICKNEEKNILKWIDSMKEADKIYVLDTGSTDNSVDLLRSNGVIVRAEVIEPWRFDTARNMSLEMVDKDADICVCTDIDERFNKGWREKLERIWNNEVNRISYNYNWSFDELGNPAVNFYISKIHSRHDYTWTHPVHEVLECINNNESSIQTDEITLNHYQDIKKKRSSYLKLLELSVKESPNDDRNMHYLGREYMYYKKWNKCIDTLIKHLSLPSANWVDERCASMRYIARSYMNINRFDEAEFWLQKAINESPYLREPYYELGYLMYSRGLYESAKKYMVSALDITNKSKTYLNEQYSWDGSIEDILSICEFNLGNIEKSLEYAIIANKCKPNDKRIEKNIEIIKSFL